MIVWIVDSYINVYFVKMFDYIDVEIDYVIEVIENVWEKFKYEMCFFMIMDVVLIFMNGILIVGVVGYVVWFWFGLFVLVGVVVSVMVLVLCFSVMLGWIMWVVLFFFCEFGIV